MADHIPAPEFSRPFDVERLMLGARTVVVAADEGERAALAERFGLQAIRRLRGTVAFEPLSGGRRLRARIHVEAEVVQSCVATLEPIESAVDEEVEILFERRDGEVAVDVVLESLSDAEPLTGEALDVGELVATEMALALDPYPRAPGAEEIGPGAEQDDSSLLASPFGVLRRREGDG